MLWHCQKRAIFTMGVYGEILHLFCRIQMKFRLRVHLKPWNDRGEFELDQTKRKNDIVENLFTLGHETHNNICFPQGLMIYFSFQARVIRMWNSKWAINSCIRVEQFRKTSVPSGMRGSFCLSKTCSVQSRSKSTTMTGAAPMTRWDLLNWWFLTSCQTREYDSDDYSVCCSCHVKLCWCTRCRPRSDCWRSTVHFI